MKKLTAGIFFLIVLAGCSTVKTHTGLSSSDAVQSSSEGFDFSKQETWILGYFNPDRLTYEPYSSWYDKGYGDYRPDTVAINKLLEINKDNLSIKVVMGTWCPDSRREVPRFMKIMDVWKFPVQKYDFYWS